MRKEKIYQKLQERFNPSFLELIDKSELHLGHAGNSGGDGTHLALKICAKELNEVNRIKAHRLINAVLEDDFQNGLHAIEIQILKQV